MRFRLLNVFLIALSFEKCTGQTDSAAVVAAEAAAGGTARLPCDMRPDHEASSLTVLTWHRNNVTIYSLDWRQGSPPPAINRSDGRYSHTAEVVAAGEVGEVAEAAGAAAGQLVIRPVRSADAGLYRCRVDFASSRSRDTYVQLQVIEKPTSMVLLSGNGSWLHGMAGPYREGDQPVLICVVIDGNPPPKVTWWRGAELVDDSWKEFSLQRVRNEMRIGPLHRRHHGRHYTCRADNSRLFPPLETDVIIDMILQPKSVKLYASAEPARAGPFQLQCQILGAHPEPNFLWLQDGTQLDVLQDIARDPSGRGHLSTVTLLLAAEHHGNNITCCADPRSLNEGADRMCSMPLTLSVYYTPTVVLTLDGVAANESAVLLGTNLTLVCNITANPAIFNFRWYFNDEVIKSSGEEDGSGGGGAAEGAGGGEGLAEGAGGRGEVESACPVLTLLQATSAMAGVYRCSATNREGLGVSQDLHLQVQYSPQCVTNDVVEYGLGGLRAVNMTCEVSAQPPPDTYRWLYVNVTLNASDADSGALSPGCREIAVTMDSVLEYQLDEYGFGTVLCWGQNDVSNGTSQAAADACYFSVTELSAPLPPAACSAARHRNGDLAVACEKGHDGGLPQKFTLTLVSEASEEPLMSVSAREPLLRAREPDGDYAISIVAHNDKGSSEPVIITRSDVTDMPEHGAGGSGAGGVVDAGAVGTLLLALGGGVGAVVLLACALVMGARECSSDAGSDAPRVRSLRPLRNKNSCPYATDESNCETCQESEGESECSFRRSESFHRAVSRRSSRGAADACAGGGGSGGACAASPPPRHPACRVHSLQNICGALGGGGGGGGGGRRRDAEPHCDHLLLHLPVDLPNYSIPKTPVPFYTMPRRSHLKVLKSSERCEPSNFDELPLPPPPEQFHTFRSATDILNKECPVTKPAPATTSYMNVASNGDGTREYNNVIISPMNTVGLPSTASAAAGILYAYSEDEPSGGSAEQPCAGPQFYLREGETDGRF